jgi:hypothetical protein
MASPEELTPLLPDTLPEDFSEWDGEASPEPLPIKPGEWEAWEASHSFGEPKEPHGQSTDRNSTAASSAAKPNVSASAPTAPVIVAQQKHFIDWDGEASPTPKPVNLSEWEAWEAAHSFGKTVKPSKPSVDREATLSPAVERPRASVSASSAPAPLKQQDLTSKPASGANGSVRRAAQGPEASRATSEISVAPVLPKAAAVNAKRNSPEARTTPQRKGRGLRFRLPPHLLLLSSRT